MPRLSLSRSLPRLALLPALLLGLPSGARADSPVTCPYSTESAAAGLSAGSLPGLRAALKTGHLRVVAIGSGSMMTARGHAAGSFTDYMAQALRDEIPGLKVDLSVQGERGIGSTAMLALLRKELPPLKPTLVVWQTGTVEAVRKRPLADFSRDLDTGAEIVRQAGGELILVDPLYSRMLLAHANVAPYREAMRSAAERNGAVLFSRFSLLHHWADAGVFDIESLNKTDRIEAADERSRCLGTALAQVILRSAGPEK